MFLGYRFIQQRPILLQFKENKWQVAIYLVLKIQSKIFTTFDARSFKNTQNRMVECFPGRGDAATQLSAVVHMLGPDPIFILENRGQIIGLTVTVGNEFQNSLEGEEGDVQLNRYLAAYLELNNIFPMLGNVFKFVSKDVTQKISILETRAASQPDGYLTVRAMIKHERESGCVAKERDNGCRTLLRLHRALGRWNYEGEPSRQHGLKWRGSALTCIPAIRGTDAWESQTGASHDGRRLSHRAELSKALSAEQTDSVAWQALSCFSVLHRFMLRPDLILILENRELRASLLTIHLPSQYFHLPSPLLLSPSQVGNEFQNSLEGQEGDVQLNRYLAAYLELNNIFPMLGNVFKFVSKDVTQKISILETRAASQPDGYLTVRAMIKHERESGCVAKERDNGCRTLLRLHRALEFVAEFMNAIYEASEESLVNPVWDAYNGTLAAHHTWLIRKTVGGAMYTLPTRTTLLDQCLCVCQEPTDTSKQPIRTLYLGHVTGYQLSANQGPVFPDSVGSWCLSFHNICMRFPASFVTRYNQRRNGERDRKREIERDRDRDRERERERERERVREETNINSNSCEGALRIHCLYTGIDRVPLSVLYRDPESRKINSLISLYLSLSLALSFSLYLSLSLSLSFSLYLSLSLSSFQLIAVEVVNFINLLLRKKNCTENR
eukprot:sb/3462753/